MKRFIDLKSQIDSEEREFTFFDTVTDKFVIMNGSQTWDNIDEFITDCIDEGLNESDRQRYLILIPDKWKQEEEEEIEDDDRDWDTMDIYTSPGAKVMVTELTIRNGSDYHKELIGKHLQIGVPYTVDWCDIGNSSTTVHLEEVAYIGFNSVNFVNCK